MSEMRRVARALGYACVCAALATASTGRAQSASASGRESGLSAYEQKTLAMALAKLHLTEDPAPEGKTIESIDVFTFEVFDEREGDLQLLNVFHATTRPFVLRREVLLAPGQKYDRALADETARNIRGFGQNSLVLVVPVLGSQPGTVRLFVLTKDVWSLRLAWDVRAGSFGLDTLTLQPTEINVAGTHQTLSTRFVLRPETFTLGVGYGVPRLQGKWLAVAAEANVIVNRPSGDPEGTYGYTYVTRPLFSTRTEWSWLVSNDWRDEHIRRYVDAKVFLYDARATPGKDALRDEYHARRFTETVAVTRSFGIENKLDVTLGAELNRRAYDLPHDIEARFAPEVLDEYRRVRMPVSDTRVGPALRARAYTNEYSRMHDFETLALQEDARVGYDVTAKVYPVFRELGSSRSFVGAEAAAQYTWVIGKDGLLRAGVDALDEFEAHRITDAAVEVDARAATPRLGFGRFVLDGVFVNRYRNYLNRTSLLGGDTRLRGYPTSYFSGKDLVAGNFEYRTPPLQIFTVQVGAVVFYDAGHTANGTNAFKLEHSVGAGVRILLPQFDRVVFRVDGGFPLVRPLPAGVSAFAFFLGFNQAFDLTNYGGNVAPTRGASPGLLNQ